MNIKEEIQESLDEHGDGYILKTNKELIDIICDFGFGETEFHTADVERLIVENEKQNIIIHELIKFVEDKNIDLPEKIKYNLKYII